MPMKLPCPLLSAHPRRQGQTSALVCNKNRHNLVWKALLRQRLPPNLVGKTYKQLIRRTRSLHLLHIHTYSPHRSQRSRIGRKPPLFFRRRKCNSCKTPLPCSPVGPLELPLCREKRRFRPFPKQREHVQETGDGSPTESSEEPTVLMRMNGTDWMGTRIYSETKHAVLLGDAQQFCSGFNLLPSTRTLAHWTLFVCTSLFTNRFN